jgi:fatty-acyl-CoA synthase
MTTEAGALWSAMAAVAGASPHALAIDAPDGSYCHAELMQAAGAVAARLAERGVRQGDRVAYLGLNGAAQVLLLLGAARLGAMLAPLNWRLAAEELRFILDDAGPRLLIADKAMEGLAREAWQHPAALVEEFLASPCGESVPPNQSTPAHPALLCYTSGASGRPKGALHSQAALLANAALAQDMHAMTADDHVLTVLPLFHVGGLCIQTLPALLLGARVTLMARFDPGACLALIEAARPTLTVQVPATFAALLADPGWAGADLGSLRAIATGSTDVPVPMIEAVQARGVPVIQIWGATETGPTAVYQKTAEAFSHPGSIGRPGPGVRLRLTDADGVDVAPGAAGEITVASPALASGYWKRPDALDLDGGWFRSGDVARQGPDGALWFVDRVSSVIISGGENIYPAELERVLHDVPGLAEAAVAGRPDPRWGEAPVVLAVRAPGSAVTEADILRAFDGRIARFKHPRAVVFVDALPRNAMGKIERPRLRELAALS